MKSVAIRVSEQQTPYYVRALALGSLAILAGVQLSGWIGFAPLIRHGYVDFRHLYVAGYTVRTGHGHELYDYAVQKDLQNRLVSTAPIATPFLRPPFQALLFVPFSLLPYHAAYAAFLILNLILLGASYRLMKPWMNHLATLWWWLPMALFLTFIPVSVGLMQGQDSILLLFLLTAALVLLGRDEDGKAGLITGLGLFKFQVVLPIALLFLLWRRWRFSLGFAASAAVALGVSVWLAGATQFGLYARSILSGAKGSSVTAGQIAFPVPIGQMANLHGLMLGLLGSRSSTETVFLLTLISSVILLVLTVLLCRRGQPGADALLVAITASTLLSGYLLLHDLSVLLIPIAVTLNQGILAGPRGESREQRRLTRISACLFVAPVLMSFFPGHFYLVAVLSLVFLGTLIAWLRRSDPALPHAVEC